VAKPEPLAIAEHVRQSAGPGMLVRNHCGVRLTKPNDECPSRDMLISIDHVEFDRRRDRLLRAFFKSGLYIARHVIKAFVSDSIFGSCVAAK
jgi:hypothetical protein